MGLVSLCLLPPCPCLDMCPLCRPARSGTEVAAQPEGGAQHSSPSDLLAVLQKEIEYKDREIADLRRQVHELQLAAAQRNAAAAHDGVRPDVAM